MSRKLVAAGAALALSMVAVTSRADVITYGPSKESDFLANLGSHAFDDFDDLSILDSTPSFTRGPVNGFQVTYSAVYGVRRFDGGMSTFPDFDLVLTFDTDNVYAVGGTFLVWAGDDGNPLSFQPAEIKINGDTVVSRYLPGAVFVGFISDAPIHTLTFRAEDNNFFPVMDNLYYGATVQEPNAVPLPAAALLGFAGMSGLGMIRVGRKVLEKLG